MEKILLVDNQKIERNSIVSTLTNLGFLVDVAPDIHIAYKKFLTTTYAVIVSRIKIKDKSGLDLLRYIRDNNIHSKVVVIADYSDIDTAIEAMKLGAYDFLIEPIKTDNIAYVIKSAIRNYDLVIQNKQLLCTLEVMNDEFLRKNQSLRESMTKIENTRRNNNLLNIELSRELRIHQVISDLIKSLTAQKDIQEVISETLNNILYALDLNRIVIFELDKVKRTLIPSSWSGLDNNVASLLEIPLNSKSIIFNSIRDNETRISHGNISDDDPISKLCRHGGIVAPIMTMESLSCWEYFNCDKDSCTVKKDGISECWTCKNSLCYSGNYTYEEKFFHRCLICPANRIYGCIWADKDENSSKIGEYLVESYSMLAQQISIVLTCAKSFSDLKNFNALIQKMVSAINHDFASPLTAIQTNATLIEQYDLSGEEIKRCASDILGSINKLEDYRQKFLNYKLLKKGETRTTEVNLLKHILQQCCSKMNEKISDKDISIKLDSDLDNIYFSANRLELEFMINSLISHSLSHISTAGTVEIKTSKNNTEAAISVINSCPQRFKHSNNLLGEKTNNEIDDFDFPLMRKICSKYNVDFSVDQQDNNFYKYSLVFPL